MRLSKHKLPKQEVKVIKSAKHKDSEIRKQRLEKKLMKQQNVIMKDATIEEPVELSIEEKLEAKLSRKKQNAHKVLYKKNNYNLTGKNGPRATCGHGSVGMR